MENVILITILGFLGIFFCSMLYPPIMVMYYYWQQRKINFRIKVIPSRDHHLYDIGPGWRKVLVAPFIKHLNPNARIIQIKEKLGGLRLYIEGMTDLEAFTAQQLERLSYIICEDCGVGSGSMVCLNGWYKTLCVNCGMERNQKSISNKNTPGQEENQE